MEAVKLLVDGSNGIYCWHNLTKWFPLYVKEGDEYTEVDHTISFHPDIEDWCEAVDEATNNGLYVKKEDGIYWRVEQMDGDIFAIHPAAVWDEDNDCYSFKEYKLPVSWEMSGWITVKAPSLQGAIDYCYDADLPDGGEYIDGSFKVDNEDGQIIEDEYPDEPFSFEG